MRNEHPKPDLVHESGYLSLNGKWQFALDDDGSFAKSDWLDIGVALPRQIEVPFAPECALSGIADPSFHDHCYYKTAIEIKKKTNRSYRLTFLAVDYETTVYVNGQEVCRHIGGATPFSCLVEDYLHDGLNEIAVHAYDPGRRKDIPRGKQYWKEKSEIIWYTRTSGIYRSVFLEELPKDHIICLAINGSWLKKQAIVKAEVTDPSHPLVLSLVKDGKTINQVQFNLQNNGQYIWDLVEPELDPWSPERPTLYEVVARYQDDLVRTRVGFRDIEIEEGKVLLNGQPLFQRLVLIQGYYPGGNLTPETKEAFLKDIRLAKALGFNGARIHQKTIDPWFYHYADEEGFLLWGESPSCFEYSPSGSKALYEEWTAIVKESFGHPSVIAYTPNNESWGIDDISRSAEQLAFSEQMYHHLKAIDPTRMIVSNDGWENPMTDLVGVHDYSDDNEPNYSRFISRLKSKGAMESDPPNFDRPIFAPGRADLSKPFLLTEYGGISYNASGQKATWGYGKQESQNGFLSRYRKTQEAVIASPYLVGYCYTQLYDVEQENNGLCTFDRKPKADVALLKDINLLSSE